MKKSFPATVIEIIEDGTTVVVQENVSGVIHYFHNGAINNVSSRLRKVGQKGVVQWHKVKRSWNLPFFTDTW